MKYNVCCKYLSNASCYNYYYNRFKPLKFINNTKFGMLPNNHTLVGFGMLPNLECYCHNNYINLVLVGKLSAPNIYILFPLI